MATKRKVLTLLIDLSRRARDGAAADVAKAIRAEGKERDLRQTLVGYQDDYRQASPKRHGQATGAGEIEHHRRFVDRLDGAVRDQQGREARAVLAREQSEIALSLSERRIKVLERLQDRRRLADRRREDQIAQRMTDEQAALVARRSRPR
jgi:flagellar FliJ protein